MYNTTKKKKEKKKTNHVRSAIKYGKNYVKSTKKIITL